VSKVLRFKQPGVAQTEASNFANGKRVSV